MYGISKVCTDFFLGINTNVFTYHLGTLTRMVMCSAVCGRALSGINMTFFDNKPSHLDSIVSLRRHTVSKYHCWTTVYFFPVSWLIPCGSPLRGSFGNPKRPLPALYLQMKFYALSWCFFLLFPHFGCSFVLRHPEVNPSFFNRYNSLEELISICMGMTQKFESGAHSCSVMFIRQKLQNPPH